MFSLFFFAELTKVVGRTELTHFHVLSILGLTLQDNGTALKEEREARRKDAWSKHDYYSAVEPI